jgi:hypothetical protein
MLDVASSMNSLKITACWRIRTKAVLKIHRLSYQLDYNFALIYFVTASLKEKAL